MKKFLFLFVLLLPMTALWMSCGNNTPSSSNSGSNTATPTSSPTPTPSIKTVVSSFSSYTGGVSITGMCVDSSDNLYVANYNGSGASSNLMKVNAAGTPTNLVAISGIEDVAYDGTNWYATSNTSPYFDLYSVANGVTNPSGLSGISGTTGVAVNSGATTMAVANSAGVSFYSLPGFTALGGTSYPSGTLTNGYQKLAFDNSGNLYLALSYMVVKYSIAGGAATIAGQNSSGYVDGAATSTARFGYIYAIAVDKNGNVYVVDNGSKAIREISGSTVTTLLGPTGGSVSPQFTTPTLNNPYAIAVDGSGNVFIGDQNGSGGSNEIYEYIP